MPKRRDKAEPFGSSTFGVVMILIAVVFAVFPEQRNLPFVLAATALGSTLLFIGSGRVYRPAVSRVNDTITCRYNPWREATFYLSLIGVPLLGFMMIVGGGLAGRGGQSIWRVIGILVIAATPIPLFVFARQRRRSLLRISPAGLSALVPGQQEPTKIAREDIDTVEPTTGRLGNGISAPVTQITYHDQGSSLATPHTVSFGPTNTKKTAWLTVEQEDLLGGLQAWKDGDPHDSGLMARIEKILLGNSPASPSRQD